MVTDNLGPEMRSRSFGLMRTDRQSRCRRLAGGVLTAVLVSLLAAALPSAAEGLGMLCFRGNSTHTFYGTGPIPQRPRVRWKRWLGATGVWAGTGWTGQPAIMQPGCEVVIGGLDGRVHFLDGKSGRPTREAFRLPKGGSIKGSVTLDPGGHPLMFVGNRGGFYWILSLIQARPRVLARIDGACDPRSGAVAGYWPDFDGSGLVVGNDLYVGGENSWFYRIPLRREMASSKPEAVVSSRNEWRTVYTPTISRLATESLGPSSSYASIESSPAVAGDRVYVTTGSGMILGLNRRSLALEYQYYTGDDTDASVVIDPEGFLYVASQCDYSGLQQSVLYKLDPRVEPHRWNGARKWSRAFRAIPYKGGPGHEDNLDAGVLGTPALGPNHRIYVGVATRPGKEGWLLALDTRTGQKVWGRKYSAHIWSSPVLVQDRVIMADAGGTLHCHRARDGHELWAIRLGGAIESTPVVWQGWIYVGARDGYFYALSDPTR